MSRSDLRIASIGWQAWRKRCETVAISKTLQRLLRVQDLKEDLRRRELGLAQSELAGIERAIAAAGKREQAGRRLAAKGVECTDLQDRLAGAEELNAGRRHASALGPYKEQVIEKTNELRTAFLEARVERRQTETLVATARARESAEADRCAQRDLDDLYLSKLTDTNGEEDRRKERLLESSKSDGLSKETV